MTQSLFTLGFPLKTETDTKTLSDQLAPMLPALFKAADEIGTIHYSRFVALNARTLLSTAGADRKPIGFYQAYPGSSVKDIQALIVDGK